MKLVAEWMEALEIRLHLASRFHSRPIDIETPYLKPSKNACLPFARYFDGFSVPFYVWMEKGRMSQPHPQPQRQAYRSFFTFQNLCPLSGQGLFY
jgi:hypothetical protein